VLICLTFTGEIWSFDFETVLRHGFKENTLDCSLMQRDLRSGRKHLSRRLGNAAYLKLPTGRGGVDVRDTGSPLYASQSMLTSTMQFSYLNALPITSRVIEGLGGLGSGYEDHLS